MKDKLKEHLLEILGGNSVYCGVEEALEGIPLDYWGKRKKGMPHTLFQLAEHIRLSNRDILEYIMDPDYTVGNWPEDYWPGKSAPENEGEVEKCLKALYSDLKSIRKRVKTEKLLSSIPHGEKGHTLAREVMILSNHMAYHVGQIVILRRILGIWGNRG